MFDFKRMLSETDWEKIKSIVQKIEGFEMIEVPGLDDRIARLNLDLNFRRSWMFRHYPAQ